MWNPEFSFVRREIARLEGYHRSFSMASIHHRGTEARPGLVLALDETPGAFCDGLAFQVEPAVAKETLAALRERELISSAYVERHLPVHFRSGETAVALAYVIEKTHVQYRGGMSLEDQAHTIAAASGGRGPNPEYLYNTVAHLEALGVLDDDLLWLRGRVRALEDASRA